MSHDVDECNEEYCVRCTAYSFAQSLLRKIVAPIAEPSIRRAEDFARYEVGLAQSRLKQANEILARIADVTDPDGMFKRNAFAEISTGNLFKSQDTREWLARWDIVADPFTDNFVRFNETQLMKILAVLYESWLATRSWAVAHSMEMAKQRKKDQT